METNLYTATDSKVTSRSRKWTAGIMAMLLSAALMLSACGGTPSGADPTLSDPAVDEVPAVPEAPATD